jgi:hypothetical protein
MITILKSGAQGLFDNPVYRKFLPFLITCNTSFLTRLVQIYCSILLDTTLKTCKIFLIYCHNCPSFSTLQTTLHWFLPHVICSYPSIWLYLFSVTDNEDFELSDRGLLMTSRRLSTREKISVEPTKTTERFPLYRTLLHLSSSITLSPPAHHYIPLLSAIQCYKGEGSGLAVFGLRALKGRRSVSGW